MSGGKTVVELRVHGVSGTPPEAMLNCPTEFLSQVAGDKDAGFYRRAAWIDDAASSPEADGWRRLMEAYSWGGLTSGRASRALWLLFLPFTLVNLAHWMLPPARHKRTAAVVVALLRLIALSSTLTLLLSMAVAVLDIVVWQCANLDYCSAGWGPLAALGQRSTGVRLAIGALPFVAVIGVLWYLGREETQAGSVIDESPPPDAVVVQGESSPLADTTFWNNDPAVLSMRACHVTAWTCGLAALVLAAPVTYATGLTHGVSVGLLYANLAILALVIGATLWTSATGRGGSAAPKAQSGLLVLRGVALALLAGSLVWVAVRADVAYPTMPTFLPGLRGSIYTLLVVQAILLVAVFAGTALSMRGGGPKTWSGGAGYRPTLRGYTGPFVALVGWLLGGWLSVGVGLWTAQTFGTLVFATGDAVGALVRRNAALAGAAGNFEAKVRAVNAPAPLIVPPPYVWASVATVTVIVVAGLAGLYVWRRAVRRGVTGPQSPIESGAPEEVRDRIERTRVLASLTDIGPKVIAVLAVLAVAIIALMASLFLPNMKPLADSRLWTNWITGLCVGATVSIVIALVLLVIQAYRSRQVRRVVAILWDIVTFWPRATHPLTPPSYGKRTVWDLRLRMADLCSASGELDDGSPTRVVLVAHSQGTIIAAATLMQARESTEQYPLLTFGSPLRRLYARNFPAYFGYDAMTALKDRRPDPRPRWINLWSLTDPIGGRVFDGEFLYVRDGEHEVRMRDALANVDCRILDVQQQDPDSGTDGVCLNGPVCGHSGFWIRGEYDQAVDALEAIVVPNGGQTVSAATVRPKIEAV